MGAFTWPPLSSLLRELGIEPAGRRQFLVADGRRIEMEYGQGEAPTLPGACTLEGLALAVDPEAQRLVPTHTVLYQVEGPLPGCERRGRSGLRGLSLTLLPAVLNLGLFRLLPHVGSDGDPGQDAQPLQDGLALLGSVGRQGVVRFVVAGLVRYVHFRGILHVAQSQRLLAGRWPLVSGVRPGAAGADGKGERRRP